MTQACRFSFVTWRRSVCPRRGNAESNAAIELAILLGVFFTHRLVRRNASGMKPRSGHPPLSQLPRNTIGAPLAQGYIRHFRAGAVAVPDDFNCRGPLKGLGIF